MPDESTPAQPAQVASAQETLEAWAAMRKEFNDLLVSLGATSQEGLRDGELARISYGYRRWLASKNPLALQFVKPKQYWYCILQVPQADGGVAVATTATKEHPIKMQFKGELPSNAIVSFFEEVPEEVYQEMEAAQQRRIISDLRA
jgi:hypothetical protein